MRIIHPYDPEGPEIKKRTSVLIAVVVSLVLLVILRLIYLQVVKYSRYKRLSESNRIRFQVLYPPRGNVYDRYGNLIAGNRASFDVYLVPEEIKKREKEVINKLSELLELDSKSLYERYKKWKTTHKRFEEFKVAEDVMEENLIKTEVASLFLPGVHISMRPVRDYLYGEAIAHILGYLGEISEKELRKKRKEGYMLGDVVGKTGIEALFEKFLRGKKGWEEVEVDAIGREVEVIGRKEPVKGEDITLTIDFSLQKYAYELMKDKRGVVVVMNPQNGDVLVYLSMPSYDPALFVRGIESEIWKKYTSDESAPLFDRVIYGIYPPGSTFKPFVAIAGLEEGVIDPTEKLKCHGRLRIGRKIFKCWQKWGHGKVNLMKAIAQSCDVYFYQLAMKLGPQTIEKYARIFGFGEKTGIIFKSEGKGLIISPAHLSILAEPWTAGKNALMGIGQAYIFATPMQIIRAYSAIANGGFLVKPRLVLKAGEREYEEIEREKIDINRESLSLIKEALRKVVEDPHGTAHHIRSDFFTIAGKTGTAQVVKKEQYQDLPENKIPFEWRDHALFIGFTPVDEPEIVVLVIVEHGGYGWNAAILAKKIMERFFEERRS